jgi:predicted acyltransferase
MAIKTKIIKSWFNACGLSLVLAAFIFSPAMAQETTYDDVAARFAGTPFAEWEVAGYEKGPFCLDGSSFGHPELGGFGFPTINESLVDYTLDPLQPEGFYLDAEDRVIAAHYVVLYDGQDAPDLFGHSFVLTGENEGGPPSYYQLNIWFVGALEDRFEIFNPAVTCPEGTAYVAGTLPDSQVVAILRTLVLLILTTGAALLVNMTRPKDDVTAPATGRRLISIDALRGFDMFWIAGGAGIIQALSKITNTDLVRVLITQLDHKDWEGVTFWDLIFPLFVFIMGVSLVFSLSKRVEKNGKAAAYKRIIVRSVFLFVIGVIFQSGPVASLEGIRLMGVLQRIALCYLFTGLLFCTLKPRDLAIVCATLLVGYWALMNFVPVPGVGAGNFREGTNLANYIDQQYLPLTKYDGDHDPEGLLSTLPAIATCLLGVFAGFLIKSNSFSDIKKVRLLLGCGVAGILLGFLWGLQFPVIKKIWTSSYVLVTGGYSCLFLAAFYQIIEIWDRRKWASPFVWIGANSIMTYLLSGALAAFLLNGGLLDLSMDAVFGVYGELVSSVVFTGLIILIAYLLYRRKLFLRI